MRTSAVVLVVSVLGLWGCASDVGSAGDELRQGCVSGGTCRGNATCVDDIHDACDPTLGGIDCPGSCVNTNRGGCGGPDRNYVSRDPNQCAAIMFLCADGQEPFFDDCGCGCADVDAGCGFIAKCAAGYVWDERACNCVPDNAQACGDRTCGSGQVCCNESCGICTEPGGFCTQQYCGTAL
jgi:hypothetical protein